MVRHRDQPLDDLVARLVRGHVQCGIVLVVRLVEQRRLGGEERVDEVQPGALGGHVQRGLALLVRAQRDAGLRLQQRAPPPQPGSAWTAAPRAPRRPCRTSSPHGPELAGARRRVHRGVVPLPRQLLCHLLAPRRRLRRPRRVHRQHCDSRQRLAKGGTGPRGSAPGLLRRGLLPREKRGEGGCIPRLRDLPNAAEDYPMTDRPAGSCPGQSQGIRRGSVLPN